MHHALVPCMHAGGAACPNAVTALCTHSVLCLVHRAFFQRAFCLMPLLSQDVYGFKMAPIAQELKEAGKSHAAVLPVSPQHLATSTVTIKTLDLCTMTAEDQDFTAEFRLTPLDSDGAAQQEVASVVLWFDTDFSAARCPEHPVKLSTAPHSPLTHWAQTVLPLSQPVTLSATGGAKAAKEITGRLSMARNKGKHRSLDIGLQYRAVLGDGSVVEAAGVYAMSVLG